MVSWAIALIFLFRAIGAPELPYDCELAHSRPRAYALRGFALMAMAPMVVLRVMLVWMGVGSAIQAYGSALWLATFAAMIFTSVTYALASPYFGRDPARRGARPVAWALVGAHAALVAAVGVSVARSS
jgi:hypothetical protein